MVLYRRFYPLRLNTDVSLCDGGGAVLQKPLHKSNIVAVGLVNLRGVPLAETVCADTLKAQIVTNNVELLLYGSLGDRKNQLVPANTIPQAIVFDVLLNNQRDGENAVLPCFLLSDLKAISVTIPDNIAGAQLQNIADTQA